MATTESPSSETPKPVIGIISMGDMGSGLARLLKAHGYTVVTNCTGRSQDTISRALSAGVQLLPTDTELITQSDLILSVVPPRDALQTAERILAAVSSPGATENRIKRPLYFADMNAISPSTCRTIASLFSSIPDSTLRFIDGGILGGPPSPPSPSPSSSSKAAVTEWTRPLLPTSGPYSFNSLSSSDPSLAKILNSNHISPSIGSASALKMCFASLSKGFAAIATQTVTTAHRLGVLPHLQDSLRQLAPSTLQRVEHAVVGMPPKAYRWVREMEEISLTHEIDGGFLSFSLCDEEEDAEGKERENENIFDGAAGIFKFVAEGTVLGREKVPVPGEGESGGNNKRVRGTTVGDVAQCMVEGLEERANKRRKK